MHTIHLQTRAIGPEQPAFVVAEIGINHNGDIHTALRLIDAAVAAGCDAVKFQKRCPEVCVPSHQRGVMRDTPWGRISYLAYRERLEFGREEYDRIHRHCQARGISWFASCWDEPSVEFMAAYDPFCYKIASACLTDDRLLKHIDAQGKPMMLSTGMSTMAEIAHAVSLLDPGRLLLAHVTSSYDFNPSEMNLRVIETLRATFDCPVGYSGHEVGTATTIAALALGACFIERHITLDKTMWGSDQAISLAPHELSRLVKQVRTVEAALGDGVKQVYDSERSAMERLRACS